MERIFFGVIVVFGVVILRMIFLPEDSVIGSFISYGAVLTFMVLGGRYALRRADSTSSSRSVSTEH